MNQVTGINEFPAPLFGSQRAEISVEECGRSCSVNLNQNRGLKGLNVCVGVCVCVHVDMHHHLCFRQPTRCSSKQSLFILLPSHSTCFVCLPHPSTGVHKLWLQPLVQVMNLVI
jgi:hypothetical protein